MANNPPKTHRYVSYSGQGMANKNRGSNLNTQSSAVVENRGLVSADKYPRTVKHFLNMIWWEASRQLWTCKCWSAETGTKSFAFCTQMRRAKHFTCCSIFLCDVFVTRRMCLVLTCVLPPSTVHCGGSQPSHPHTNMHSTGLSPPRFPAGLTVPHHIADLQDSGPSS